MLGVGVNFYTGFQGSLKGHGHITDNPNILYVYENGYTVAILVHILDLIQSALRFEIHSAKYLNVLYI